MKPNVVGHRVGMEVYQSKTAAGLQRRRDRGGAVGTDLRGIGGDAVVDFDKVVAAVRVGLESHRGELEHDPLAVGGVDLPVAVPAVGVSPWVAR